MYTVYEVKWFIVFYSTKFIVFTTVATTAVYTVHSWQSLYAIMFCTKFQ